MQLQIMTHLANFSSSGGQACLTTGLLIFGRLLHTNICAKVLTQSISSAFSRPNIIKQTPLYTYSKKAAGFEEEQLIFATDIHTRKKREKNQFFTQICMNR
jgi:hypothetical protein